MRLFEQAAQWDASYAGDEHAGRRANAAAQSGSRPSGWANAPFARDLLAAYYCAFDAHAGARERLTLPGALAYLCCRSTSFPMCCH